MGWDAFGLPAEQHAIKTGTQPRVTTEQNIATFRRQIKMLGFSYDWDRELATTDPEYFRWTQWIFLRAVRHLVSTQWTDAGKQERPADRRVADSGRRASGGRRRGARDIRTSIGWPIISEAPVNWCPALGTVLANEEVVGGKSERGGHPVVRMPLRQWMLRITAYADRLENDLELARLAGEHQGAAAQLDRPQRGSGGRFLHRRRPRGRTLQQAWKTIAPKSRFSARSRRRRPPHLHDPARHALRRDVHGARAGASVRRAAHHARARRGGRSLSRTRPRARATSTAPSWPRRRPASSPARYAINPVNGEPIPIWIADYVLISYGTGAIMAVPGARRARLRVRQAV